MALTTSKTWDELKQVMADKNLRTEQDLFMYLNGTSSPSDKQDIYDALMQWDQNTYKDYEGKHRTSNLTEALTEDEETTKKFVENFSTEVYDEDSEYAFSKNRSLLGECSPGCRIVFTQQLWDALYNVGDRSEDQMPFHDIEALGKEDCLEAFLGKKGTEYRDTTWYVYKRYYFWS
jgi:hypothetical protein